MPFLSTQDISDLRKNTIAHVALGGRQLAVCCIATPFSEDVIARRTAGRRIDRDIENFALPISPNIAFSWNATARLKQWIEHEASV
jgi:hypothetical protein